MHYLPCRYSVMLMDLKPALVVLWMLAVTSSSTELNIYISKEHLAEYYNFNIGMLKWISCLAFQHKFLWKDFENQVNEFTMMCILFSVVDTKVLVVHNRQDHVGPHDQLTFNNKTLPPFPESVNKVTFSWLTTANEEVNFAVLHVLTCYQNLRVIFMCWSWDKSS